jgi:ABC-type transporter Mla subunit MlaD
MTQVRSFVADNKQLLGTNISGLKRISGTLVKRRQAIDEILRVAPGALNNLALAYNGTSGTLDTRANVGETANQLSADPKTVLCTFLGTTPAGNSACKSLAGALGRTSPFRSQGVTAPSTTVVEPIDRTLAGLVEVKH